jgi:hypothetical protein
MQQGNIIFPAVIFINGCTTFTCYQKFLYLQTKTTGLNYLLVFGSLFLFIYLGWVCVCSINYVPLFPWLRHFTLQFGNILDLTWGRWLFAFLLATSWSVLYVHSCASLIFLDLMFPSFFFKFYCWDYGLRTPLSSIPYLS